MAGRHLRQGRTESTGNIPAYGRVARKCPCGAVMCLGPILSARQLHPHLGLRCLMTRRASRCQCSRQRGDARRDRAPRAITRWPTRHLPGGTRRRSRAAGTPEDPDSSSIAGRRASGFLQVSLSKAPPHRHRGHAIASGRGTSDAPATVSDVFGKRACPKTARTSIDVACCSSRMVAIVVLGASPELDE